MKKSPKYRINDDFRIEALRSFGNVKKGDIGGFVESTANLSHFGNCWVYDDAEVLGNATVRGNASVYDRAKVSDNATLFDDAHISDNAQILGNASIYNEAMVYQNVIVRGDTRVFADAWVYGDFIIDSGNICDKCTMSPIVLKGLSKYIYTITDSSVSVDCVNKTFREWFDITERELLMLDGKDAVYAYRENKDLIVYILENKRELPSSNR